MIKLFFITLLLTFSLFSNEGNPSSTRSFNQIILDNQINIRSKSLKNWIRIFNSQSKIKSNGYTVSNTERFTLLKGLKAKQKKSKNRYSRRIR